jgi:hypothetical protein
MLNATEPNGELSPREPEAAREQISLIEMSDEEILSWLTTSILDEPEPVVGERGEDGSASEFWDRVAAIQATLSDLGYGGAGAIQCAIGLVGLEFGAESVEPANADDVELASGTRFDQQHLLRVQAELVERAGRAVALWATFQGSALRAASVAKA